MCSVYTPRIPTGNTTLAAMQSNGNTHTAGTATTHTAPGDKGSRGAKARAKKQAKKREREQASDDEDLAGGMCWDDVHVGNAL